MTLASQFDKSGRRPRALLPICCPDDSDLGVRPGVGRTVLTAFDISVLSRYYERVKSMRVRQLAARLSRDTASVHTLLATQELLLPDGPLE